MRHVELFIAGLMCLGCAGVFSPPEIDESQKPKVKDKIVREKRKPGQATREVGQANPAAVARATSGLNTVWGEVIKTEKGYRQPECEGRPLVVTLTKSRIRVGHLEKAEFFDLLDGHRTAGRVNLTVEDSEGVSAPGSFRWLDRTANIGQWDLPGHHFAVMPKGQLPAPIPCPEE